MKGLTTTGWGPFPLPGEKKRVKRARRKAEQTMELLRQVQERDSAQQTKVEE